MRMIEIDEKLEHLEIISRTLDPDYSSRQDVVSKVLNYTEDLIDGIGERMAYVAPKQDFDKWLTNSPIVDNPISIADILHVLKSSVDQVGINCASGGHLGYIPGGGLFYAALGDFLAAVFNHYAGIYFSAPGAVKLERQLLAWMAEIIGYPSNCGGDLTSGSSIGVLIAINTAREKYQLRANDYNKTVVYLSVQAHHSLEKSLRIAGLGDCIVRRIPVDVSMRIIPSTLSQIIEDDFKKGLNPWMVFATAGTTDCGVIDPLKEIGQITRQYSLWYHIDAAYGGFFALVKEARSKLDGMEISDSIALDPHKGLSLPFGIGAILIKDKNTMIRAHSYQANYMRDAKVATDEVSPSDVSPELTKHFRGLRMWLPLKLHGVAAFKAHLEEKLLLAQYFYLKIQEIEHFEVGPKPDLSIVTFRYVPEGLEADDFNQLLVKEIHDDGRVFLTSTKIHGRTMLRLAILSFRTHKKTIDLAISILIEKVEQLKDCEWNSEKIRDNFSS